MVCNIKSNCLIQATRPIEATDRQKALNETEKMHIYINLSLQNLNACMQNHMSMMMKRLKYKSDAEFQYGSSLFSEAISCNISDVH